MVEEQKTDKVFEQTDIDAVKELQSEYASITAQIGQVEVEIHLLEERLGNMKAFRSELFSNYSETRVKEKTLVDSLNSKYGDGTLDLDSGRFIPSTI